LTSPGNHQAWITVSDTDISHSLAYHGIDDRLEELTTPGKFESDAHSNAARQEYNALIHVQQDIRLTGDCHGKMSGAAIAVANMNGNRNFGQPIDLLELKDQMQKQMQELASSGAEREDRMALLAILSQKAGEAILGELSKAASPEARAIMLKQATNTFETAGRLTEKLHHLERPKGTVVDGQSIALKQKPDNTKANQLLEDKNDVGSDISGLDTRAAEKTGRSDSKMATVGKKHRANK